MMNKFIDWFMRHIRREGGIEQARPAVTVRYAADSRAGQHVLEFRDGEFRVGGKVAGKVVGFALSSPVEPELTSTAIHVNCPMSFTFTAREDLLTLPELNVVPPDDPAYLAYVYWLASYLDRQPDQISRLMAKVHPQAFINRREWGRSQCGSQRAYLALWHENMRLAMWQN